MKPSGRALPVSVLGSRDGEVRAVCSQKSHRVTGVAPEICGPATAAVHGAEIKFAIYSPVKKFSAGGWEVTDTHIILAGKTRPL